MFCENSLSLMREQVITWLAENVPSSRLDHVLRVEQMAVGLAAQHNLNEEKAAKASLMHDLAKYYKPQKLLEMARAEALDIDEVMVEHPHLLHADVSAIIARDTFGINDEEVLQAIANHTLGRPGMSQVSCIVFLSDSLEPGRGNTSELQALREISVDNLDRAVWLTCDYTLKILLEIPGLIHPRVITTRNWFFQQWKSNGTRCRA